AGAGGGGVQVRGGEEGRHLTREELERVAGPLIDRAVDETRRVFQRAGLSDGGAGILLVGGSSRIPLVASRLHTRFGIAPTVPEQPELPVAYGALLTGAVARSGLAAAPVSPSVSVAAAPTSPPAAMPAPVPAAAAVPARG